MPPPRRGRPSGRRGQAGPWVLRFAIDDLARGVTREKVRSYAAVLLVIATVGRQLGLTKDALGVLEKAVQGQVTDEFRNMVATTIDAWSNRITGGGR